MEAGETSQQTVRGPVRGFAPAFAIIGLLTVILTTIDTNITHIPHDAQFGLLQLLPLSYWLGLFLMGLAIVLALASRSDGMVVVTGALFLAVLGGIPGLFESNPPVWDSYFHLGMAQDIGSSGLLPTAHAEYSKNWPGSFLLISFLGVVGSLGPFTMLTTLPFLTAGLTFLGLFVFLRTLLPRVPAAGAAILGSLLNVWAQFHLSPQSIGLFLALMVLATIWDRRIAVRTASAILFVGLVVTHPTSTVLVLGILVVDAVLTSARRVRRSRKDEAPEVDKRFAHNPALSLGAVWVAWLFFQATATSEVAEAAIINRIAFILQVPEQTLGLGTLRVVENIFVIAPLVRLAALLVYGIIGLAALVLLSRRPETRRLAQFFWAALISMVIFVGADILAFQGLFVDRALILFAILIPAICLVGVQASKMGRPAKGAIVALLVISSVASASTIYYQEAFYFVSDKSVAVSEYLQLVEQPSLILDGQYPVAVWRAPDDRAVWNQLAFVDLFPTSFQDLTGTNTVYAVFDSEWKLWYRQWYGIDRYEVYEVNRTSYSLIYTNGQADIYFITSPSPAEQ